MVGGTNRELGQAPLVLVRLRMLVLALSCAGAMMVGCDFDSSPPEDDAKAAGLTELDFPQVAVDVFRDMDGGLALSPDEIKGRNSWILWTAGNQLFWDRLARSGYGLVDLIKTLDSRRRSRRFSEIGLINQPGFRPATGPDRYGLWLDEPEGNVEEGVDWRINGRPSGVIGFRVYPNPEFDDDAERQWNPDRYYNDPAYYTDPNLIRPYRIGVTCGSCHVAFNPLHPPADPENPEWRNLSSAIGNQYIREGRAFIVTRPGSFFQEMLDAQPPGTSDTSRTANDHINNPSAINGIFLLYARLDQAAEEKMSGGALAWPGEGIRKVPRILKDGADSVGAAGAMMRVYVNEGLYSQQFLTDHDLLLGLRTQRPFPVGSAFRNSVYWRATYARTANIARYFARLKPMRLKDAPGGSAYITSDRSVMNRGKIVFAENCAACHSSKQPPDEIDPRSEAGREWFRQSVMRDDFRDDNFLSDERRYPVTLLKTNACRALATNATRGHIWDNFSSETYKSLPSVGTIVMYNPGADSEPYRFKAPAGGLGYYRSPSLIAIWSSAPFLHNNALGVFTGDPSVAGRMRAFDDAIEKLLWPEKRLGKDSIRRTTDVSDLKIAEAFLPRLLRPLAEDGFLRIGPIPKGTPINLLANVNPSLSNTVNLIGRTNDLFSEAAEPLQNFSELLATASPDNRATQLVDALMAASKCPDLIEDRGHLFGAQLPDADKRALIEFLKTL